MKTKFLTVLLLGASLYSFQAVAGDDDDIANIRVKKSGDANAMQVPELSDADKEAQQLRQAKTQPKPQKQANNMRDPFQAPAAATAAVTPASDSADLNAIQPAAGQ